MCLTVEIDVVMLNIFPGNPRHANMCKSMNIEKTTFMIPHIVHYS